MIEILYIEGCPNHDGLAARVRSLAVGRGMDVPIVERRIHSDDQAEAEHFLGSPSIRVNGVDVDPTAAEDAAFGLTCRVYPGDEGLRSTPPDAWIVAALDRLA